MDKFEVSLAEILGIENEYDLLNKQAKVCNHTKSYSTNRLNKLSWDPLIMHLNSQPTIKIDSWIKMEDQIMIHLDLSVVRPYTRKVS
jgi:hypothetical protein